MTHREKGLEGAVLIAGPTASGKSALALALAERVGGVVVNADSMQVYRELAVLSARPGPAEEGRVRHRLYGHVPAAEVYSVGRWLEDVEHALDGIGAAVPIVVGGTGLYFQALTEGLSEIPATPENVRAHWREAAERQGVAHLHAELARRDPPMAARLRPSDPQRVIRALEVLDATGQSLLTWQARRTTPLIGPDVRRFVLDVPRATLAGRIEARARSMAEGGGLEEVQALLALGLDAALPAMRALGVQEFGAVVQGRASLEEGISALAANTRRYAKRQSTWFRNQTPDWHRITSEEPWTEVQPLLERVFP